jgi:hypothetical protein
MIYTTSTQSLKRKVLASSVAAFAFICTAATVIADNANLSGQWKLNEPKSELGEFGARIAAKTIRMDQKADGISIDKTSSFNGQERTNTEKLTFDGKETESTTFGTAKRKATAKWSQDGKTLTVDATTLFERDGQTMEFKSTETYKLSDDGKSLIIDVNSTSPRGNTTTKMVYDKA